MNQLSALDVSSVLDENYKLEESQTRRPGQRIIDH